MNITLKLENGHFIPYDKLEKDKLDKLKNGIYQIKLSNLDLRTLAQNRAFHLYFSMVANSLNDSGLYINKLIQEDKYKADIDWNLELVKKNLWTPIQVSIYDKKSTTQLNKNEIDRVYNVLNRYLSNMGIIVPFPNAEIKNIKD